MHFGSFHSSSRQHKNAGLLQNAGLFIHSYAPRFMMLAEETGECQAAGDKHVEQTKRGFKTYSITLILSNTFRRNHTQMTEKIL